MLRDRVGLLFDAVRGCCATAWVDWMVDALAIERGLQPARSFGESEAEDIGERLARTSCVLFGVVRPYSI